MRSKRPSIDAPPPATFTLVATMSANEGRCRRSDAPASKLVPLTVTCVVVPVLLGAPPGDGAPLIVGAAAIVKQLHDAVCTPLGPCFTVTVRAPVAALPATVIVAMSWEAPLIVVLLTVTPVPDTDTTGAPSEPSNPEPFT